MLIRNLDWSSGLRAHQNQFADDKLGLFPASIAMLAENAKNHRFDSMVQLLLNGFNGTVFPAIGNGLAYDGAFFFSNGHTVDGGPPQSNYMGPVPLTVSSMEAAETKLKTMKTADGKQPLRMRGSHLIVGPQLEWVAKKIVGTEVIANASGTAAETNIHKGQYEVIVSPRITDGQANNWFLSDLRRPIKPGIFQLRQDIITSAILGNIGGNNDSPVRFQRGEYWFGAEARYNVAPWAWQTIVGANPPSS
jgi:phage major head subunit gpT-like protein